MTISLKKKKKAEEIGVAVNVYDEFEKALLSNDARTHTRGGISDLYKELIGDVLPNSSRISYCFTFYRGYMLEVLVSIKRGLDFDDLKRVRIYRGFES